MIKLQLEQSFVSFISNFPSPVELVITQSLDQVKIRLTSQLIKRISRVLQKLLKYFHGTIISTSFVFPSAGVYPVIFILDLNDSEFAIICYHLQVIIWLIFVVLP